VHKQVTWAVTPDSQVNTMVLSASLPLLTHIDLWRLLDKWHKMKENAYISLWVAKFNMRKQSKKWAVSCSAAPLKNGLNRQHKNKTSRVSSGPPGYRLCVEGEMA